MTMKGTSKTAVAYACQKCNAPLKIHISFNDMDRSTYDEIISDPILEDNQSSVFIIPSNNPSHLYSRDVIAPCSFWESPAADAENISYLLNDSGIINNRLKISAYLFDYLSGKTPIDHPLCQDCVDALINTQDKTLANMEIEIIALQRYLDNLKKNSAESPTEDVRNQELAAAKNSFTELESEEALLLAELASLQSQENALDEELTLEKQTLEGRQADIHKLTSDYNEEKRVLLEEEEELKALEARLRYSKDQLDRLRKTNVVNLAFNIWYAGHMGVINGLRMGRLPSNPVEWPEINAGWGHCTLLLSCLAKKIDNFVFDKYRVVPMGSTSYVVNIAEKKEYPLYNHGGFKIFNDSRLDHAMVMFVECVGQLQAYIESTSTTTLPYRILEKGKIQDERKNTFSIKLQSNSEENWTKALKYLLITLKWMLSITVARQAEKSQIPSQSTPGQSMKTC